MSLPNDFPPVDTVKGFFDYLNDPALPKQSDFPPKSPWYAFFTKKIKFRNKPEYTYYAELTEPWQILPGIEIDGFFITVNQTKTQEEPEPEGTFTRMVQGVMSMFSPKRPNRFPQFSTPFGFFA